MHYTALIQCFTTRLRRVLLLVAGGLITALLTGCASTAPEVDPIPPKEPVRAAWSPAPVTPTQPARPAAPNAKEQRLRRVTQDWLGVPYRYGGTSRSGIDCSAFVQAVYLDAFDLALPRVTGEQVRAGTGVPRNHYQPGDLVFFRPSGKGRHVGIYLGAGEFAHASTSRGVTVSRLDEPYWRETYWTSRRVLPDEITPVAISPPDLVPSGPRGDARTGW